MLSEDRKVISLLIYNYKKRKGLLNRLYRIDHKFRRRKYKAFLYKVWRMDIGPQTKIPNKFKRKYN